VTNLPDESNRYLPALRASLLMLSLPPADQLRINAHGCVACELLDEFSISCKDVLDNNITEETQAQLLRRIQSAIKAMPERDFECFNPNVLRRESWQILRELSHEALSIFGWHDARLAPFTEVEPGVWLRRRSFD